MDWLIIITACFAVAFGITLYFFLQRKKDEKMFAEALDRDLDRILVGQPPLEEGIFTDSLGGKCSEKLGRLYQTAVYRENRLQQERTRLQELIGDISHQTKIPIANMKLYLELLGDRVDPAAMQMLESAAHQCDKLDFLLQSMIKISRLETGAISIVKNNEDLVATIRSAVAAIVPQAAQKGISLIAACGPGFLLPHDRRWTEEAIFNLLDNAVKYTPTGGEICISLKKTEFFAVVSVKDNGKGIAKERQAKIFDRFYREPEVHDKDGIGLGLFLVRKIAELQAGYVEVCSEPKQGTDFRIYLPISSQNCENAPVF